ncbi:MAG: hypothetical protein CFE32_15385, partial [Alphaproteobacteria bacterium PA3]
MLALTQGATAQNAIASQEMPQAEVLKLDRVQKGKLSSDDTEQNPKYSFKSDIAQTLEVSLVSKDFDPILIARNENGGVVAFNDDFGRSKNSRIRVTMVKDQTIFFDVSTFTGQGEFELTARRDAPLSVRSEALAQVQSQSIRFEPPTRDVPPFKEYSVLLEANQTLEVEVQRLNPLQDSFDPILAIGREVAGNFIELTRDNESNGGMNPKLIYRALERGKYYLRISSADGRGIQGYTFTYKILGNENTRGVRTLPLSQGNEVDGFTTVGELSKDQKGFQTDLQFERFKIRTPKDDQRLSFLLATTSNLRVIGFEQLPTLRITSIDPAGREGAISFVLRPWDLSGGRASFAGVFPVSGDYWVDVVAPESMKNSLATLRFSIRAILLPNSRVGGDRVTELRLSERLESELSGTSPFFIDSGRTASNFGDRSNSVSVPVFRAFEYFSLPVTSGRSIEITVASKEFDTMLDVGGFTPLGFASVEKND